MKEYQKPSLYVTVFTGGREEIMLVSGNYTKGNFTIYTNRADAVSNCNQLDAQ
jgi:hypothetical protein